jgi:ribonuclease Z
MGPRNLGTVVRVAANLGPVEVALVDPQKRSMLVHPEFEQMAHGAEEVAERVLVFDTLSEALADCTDSIGFTARSRDHRVVLAWDELQGGVLAASDADDQRVALVFGNEESGLSSAEADLVRVLAHLPTSGEHTSLNLGMTVGIVLFSLFRGETPDEMQSLGAPLVGSEREYLKRRALVAPARAGARQLEVAARLRTRRHPAHDAPLRGRAMTRELPPPPDELELAGHRIRALSIGGLETVIDLPDLGVAFDVGRAPRWSVRRRTILFTHSHIDHMGGIASHAATRELLGMPAPRYVVPRESVAGLTQLFAAWRRLDGARLSHELVPLAPGEEVEVKRGVVARPFRSHHTAPCQGYGLWSVKKKLLPELVGLPEEEVARRATSGERVSHPVENPEVAFVGDTRIEVVEREPVVREARLLVLEVTFVDERVDVESAREKGHVHLDEVAERADLFENEDLLFTHFSARYTAAEIVRALDEKLPPALRARVTPLLTGHA